MGGMRAGGKEGGKQEDVDVQDVEALHDTIHTCQSRPLGPRLPQSG